MSSQAASVHHGNVKQVLSGDCLVLRAQVTRGGPPPERTIALSGIVCPRIARRPPANAERFQADARDEPWGWEAREFVRKRCIGKDVSFVVENKAPSGREYGQIYLGNDTSAECLGELLLSEGLAEARRQGPQTDAQGRFIALEEGAKSQSKGKWDNSASSSHVREIVWNPENLMQFVQTHQGRELPAIIEHVRDGSTLRAFVVVNKVYHNVMVMLSGVKAPAIRLENDKQIPEPFALEARYFVERRLLQREVRIIPETASTNNLVGSIIHPNGNIAELLLREGFARCVDWNMGNVTGGAEKLRTAEKLAKSKKLRLWKDYSGNVGDANNVDRATYTGKVIEVGNGDNLSVKCQDGVVRKFFLASVRAPRPGQAPAPESGPPASNPKTRSRPLYDIPYMFEAREFLRKKLVGKKVTVRTDYVQPKNEGFEERLCATVMMGEMNVAEALISKGLGSVIRYRADDDKRSSAYDALLAAEAVAQKKAVGIHSKKEPPTHRVADITGDATKSKQFLPFLRRSGRLQAIVEYVAGGSRLRLYIHSDTCLITFLLGGIDCPRSTRRLPNGHEEPGDPFGAEAAAFTRDMCMQREVEVELESVDKGGNFIGWLWVEGVMLNVSLVEHGLAKVHFSAERSAHYAALSRAEDKARQERLNLWSLEIVDSTGSEHAKEEVSADREDSRSNGLEEEKSKNSSSKAQYKKGYMSSMSSPGLRFFVQFLDVEASLRRIRETLDSELGCSPPLAGSYTPRKGDICAAKFTEDNQWYRARVENINRSANQISVFYIDFGNSEVLTDGASRLTSLPSQLASVPAQATAFRLAGVALPPDEDDVKAAVEAFQVICYQGMIAVNTEYELEGNKFASVVIPKVVEDGDSGEEAANEKSVPVDVAEKLLEDGFVYIEPTMIRGRDAWRMKHLIKRYQMKEESAKKARRNIWRYGDFRGEENL